MIKCRLYLHQDCQCQCPNTSYLLDLEQPLSPGIQKWIKFQVMEIAEHQQRVWAEKNRLTLHNPYEKVQINEVNSETDCATFHFSAFFVNWRHVSLCQLPFLQPNRHISGKTHAQKHPQIYIILTCSFMLLYLWGHCVYFIHSLSPNLDLNPHNGLMLNANTKIALCKMSSLCRFFHHHYKKKLIYSVRLLICY